MSHNYRTNFEPKQQVYFPFTSFILDTDFPANLCYIFSVLILFGFVLAGMVYRYFLQVGLVIGKGGETIKNMQASTGARIQVSLFNIIALISVFL